MGVGEGVGVPPPLLLTALATTPSKIPARPSLRALPLPLPLSRSLLLSFCLVGLGVLSNRPKREGEDPAYAVGVRVDGEVCLVGECARAGSELDLGMGRAKRAAGGGVRVAREVVLPVAVWRDVGLVVDE